ncbi:hypothetical protein KJ359_011317 [Pestalotiopsis sp. 9143b]|nr:hypothetical protein KJ359_011317 [Pestalotiopsis sp. 9143b]
MDSGILAAKSPQQVNGQSAFWILVTLATAAVTQPSTCSRRKGRDIFGGTIDLLRCVPLLCLFDGIVDLIVLDRAIRREVSLRTGHADQERRRLPPLKPNMAAVMLAISILTVLPQTIKVFSMRGVPWTQLCASLYFFAIMTKLVIEFSRLETDGDCPDLEVISTLLELLHCSGQLIMEVAIWYNMTLSVMALLPLDDLSPWKFMLISAGVMTAFMYDLVFLTPEKVLELLSFTGSIVFALSCGLFSSSLGFSSMTKYFQIERMDGHEARIKNSPSPARRLGYAICLIICVGFVSILVANTISAVGHLIASSGKVQTPSPDTRAGPVPEPITSSSVGQPAESDATGLSTAHHESRSRPESDGSTIVAITIFNLITTVCYYLVWFDGTETFSPDWVSTLG